MILFVRENCNFCQDLPEVADLKIYQVIETDDGPKVEMSGDTKIDLPPMVQGLPALLIGADLYVGKDKILPKLKELAAAV